MISLTSCALTYKQKGMGVPGLVRCMDMCIWCDCYDFPGQEVLDERNDVLSGGLQAAQSATKRI